MVYFNITDQIADMTRDLADRQEKALMEFLGVKTVQEGIELLADLDSIGKQVVIEEKPAQLVQTQDNSMEYRFEQVVRFRIEPIKKKNDPEERVSP